jgi:hypothetical protein
MPGSVRAARATIFVMAAIGVIGTGVAVLLGSINAEVTWTGRGLSNPDAKQQAIDVARTAVELATK